MWEVGRVRSGVCSQLPLWAASAPLKMSGGWSSPPLAPRPVVPGGSTPLSGLTPLSPAPRPRWFPVHHPQLPSAQRCYLLPPETLTVHPRDLIVPG